MANNDIEYIGLKQHPEVIKSFATIMNEIEDSRGSTRLKFLQAHLIFSGKTYEVDKKPFQDFSNLFKLRDAFLHLKPQSEYITNSKNEFIRVSPPKVINGLPKNILAKFETKVIANWISMVSTQAAAKWACDTASEMVISILRVIPDSFFKKSAIRAYGKTFQPVDYQPPENK